MRVPSAWSWPAGTVMLFACRTPRICWIDDARIGELLRIEGDRDLRLEAAGYVGAATPSSDSNVRDDLVVGDLRDGLRGGPRWSLRSTR